MRLAPSPHRRSLLPASVIQGRQRQGPQQASLARADHTAAPTGLWRVSVRSPARRRQPRLPSGSVRAAALAMTSGRSHGGGHRGGDLTFQETNRGTVCLRLADSRDSPFPRSPKDPLGPRHSQGPPFPPAAGLDTPATVAAQIREVVRSPVVTAGWAELTHMPRAPRRHHVQGLRRCAQKPSKRTPAASSPSGARASCPALLPSPPRPGKAHRAKQNLRFPLSSAGGDSEGRP